MGGVGCSSNEEVSWRFIKSLPPLDFTVIDLTARSYTSSPFCLGPEQPYSLEVLFVTIWKQWIRIFLYPGFASPILPVWRQMKIFAISFFSNIRTILISFKLSPKVKHWEDFFPPWRKTFPSLSRNPFPLFTFGKSNSFFQPGNSWVPEVLNLHRRKDFPLIRSRFLRFLPPSVEKGLEPRGVQVRGVSVIPQRGMFSLIGTSIAFHSSVSG